MRLNTHSPQRGFSLIESTIAAAIAALFLSSLFTMNMTTMDAIRAAKESISASQVLQQRMESLRIANWHEVTDASWLRDNLLNANAAGSDLLKDLAETLILVPYGSSNVGNTQLTRTDSAVSIVNENPTLLTENAVKIIWTINYTGAPNARQLSRQIVAVLAKGGVAR